MLLAELEVWHSRSIAPTRRVALGERLLPVSPPPGLGGLLLGGIVASAAPDLDPELAADLGELLDRLQDGPRIPQPQLRHRFQTDRHGLARTTHRLLGEGDALRLEVKGDGSPASQALAAAYAAAELPSLARREVMVVLRRGLRWRGGSGPPMFRHLASSAPTGTWSALAFADPARWALDVLELSGTPDRREVQRAFRVLLRAAHPDHGADADVAATRIADLREARRILLW